MPPARCLTGGVVRGGGKQDYTDDSKRLLSVVLRQLREAGECEDDELGGRRGFDEAVRDTYPPP
jgi:hypothetical protein